jgi:UDP-N-acetylglucosamine--dolichyl-phosphate N-acetylglucosaminephosphotransferase
MKDIALALPIIASFFIVLLFMPLWIRKAKQIGLMWNDMNKLSKGKVAGSGGIIVLTAFVISLFVFVAYRTFVLNDTSHLIEIIALSSVVLLAGGIGFIDDLLGWQHGGLSRKSRIIMVIIAAIPLMAINAGKHSMALPLLGTVDFGLLYPLLFIPLGIVATTTTFNFLAGFNGLEAGSGAIILSALSLVAFLTGNSWLALAGLCMVAALLAFLFFNFTPARVFPGDVMTYSAGAMIAIIAILGNFEKIAVFFFIPFIIEVFLKGRGRYIKSSFGKPMKDGSLDMLYDKVYGLTHLAIYLMKKLGIKPTEKKVVLAIWAFQIIVIVVGLCIFREGIF